MRKLVLPVLVMMAATLSGSGCGGLSQEDMMRNAIRRPSDDELQASSNTTAATDPAEADKPAGTAMSEAAGTGATPELAITPTSPAGSSAANSASSPQAQAATTAAPVAARETATDSEPTVAATRTAAGAEPLTPRQQQATSAENMRRIAQAMQEYVDKEGLFPPPAIVGPSRVPTLSWRVSLLPYLGLEPLYQRFKQDQPWDSPENLALLKEIPAVYQSPARRDEQTNYLVPVSNNSAFSRPQGELLSNFEDGVASTLVLLEVDDSHAVPWTKPQDYAIPGRTPKAGLGNLRAGYFLAVWGDGTLHAISAATPDATMHAMFTIDGGEPLNRNLVGQLPEQALTSATVPAETPRLAEASGKTEAAVGHSASLADSRVPGRAAPRLPSLGRLPVPDAEAQAKARETFREIYQAEYARARTASERQELSRKLLEEAGQVTEDPASLYVLLQIARDIAAPTGNVDTSLEATELLVQFFEVDALELRLKTYNQLAQAAGSGGEHKKLIDAILPTLEEALAADEHPDALELATLAVSSARKARDHRQMNRLTYLKQKVADTQLAYAAANQALETLEGQPDDAAARHALGKYLCLYKEDWENGLPILAQSSNTRLRRLAELELERPQTAEQQVALGDGWWEMAQDASPGDQAAMWQRALYWYEQALPNLPGGLVKVKVQKRLETAEWLEQ